MGVSVSAQLARALTLSTAGAPPSAALLLLQLLLLLLLLLLQRARLPPPHELLERDAVQGLAVVDEPLPDLVLG